jgi:hypothetical protein
MLRLKYATNRCASGNQPARLGGLLLLVLAVGHGCGAAPPRIDETVTCECLCDDACSDQHVDVVHSIDGSRSAFCSSIDPDFPNALGTSMQALDTCVRDGAGEDVVNAACSSRCNHTGLKEFFPTAADGGGLLFVGPRPGQSVVGGTRRCSGFTRATVATHDTCRVTGGGSFSESALTTSGPSNTTVQATSQSTATAMLPNESEGFDTVTIPAPSGSLLFSGGVCPGNNCTIQIDRMTLNVPPFTAQGRSVGPGTVVNTQAIVGTKDELERVTFAPPASTFFATATVDGVQSAGELLEPPLLRGSYSPATGALQINGSFVDPSTGASLAIQFQGSATARPPIANAGADQTVACPATGGLATVSVSGAGTIDPEGNSMTFAWAENGIVLATTSVASLSLTSGSHNLVLTATDSTGRVNQDDVVVTVTDGVAPRFTFVPPTVVVETSGPVNIGLALATDGCGGSAAVTNNAPGSFPIGRTVVTWTATDPSGNRATATQEVFVLPPIAASCPAGSNVIMGTSNNDVLIGTNGPDCIIGFGGQDRLEGRGGNDMLLGGEGNDTLLGGIGNDTIVGGGGQDTGSGEAGNDLVAGASGDDILSGGDGTDTLVGGDGQDRLNGDAANDVLAGNAGDDILNGGAGTDRCVVEGHDQLTACE